MYCDTYIAKWHVSFFMYAKMIVSCIMGNQPAVSDVYLHIFNYGWSSSMRITWDAYQKIIYIYVEETKTNEINLFPHCTPNGIDFLLYNFFIVFRKIIIWFRHHVSTNIDLFSLQNIKLKVKLKKRKKNLIRNRTKKIQRETFHENVIKVKLCVSDLVSTLCINF